jgi:Uma2 family endonuclease
MSIATLPDIPQLGEAGSSPDDAMYEIVNGQRVEIPPMSSYAAKIATRLATRLNFHAEKEKVGEAIVESLFRLPLAEDMSRNRRPDVAFVSSTRWPAGRAQPLGDNAWDVVPDLTIEVVSPHDLAEDLLEKTLEYFQAGVRLVWVVYPRHRLIHVYDGPNSIKVLQDTDALDGGQVLSEFSLPMSQLFDPVPPAG